MFYKPNSLHELSIELLKPSLPSTDCNFYTKKKNTLTCIYLTSQDHSACLQAFEYNMKETPLKSYKSTFAF